MNTHSPEMNSDLAISEIVPTPNDVSNIPIEVINDTLNKLRNEEDVVEEGVKPTVH